MILQSEISQDMKEKINLLFSEIKAACNSISRTAGFVCSVAHTDKTEKIAHNYHVETSSFANYVIISFQSDQPRDDLLDIYGVLISISVFAFQLLYKGFFLRGGLSYGNLYHKGDVCFGPALVNAVTLERKATYPCIAIDPFFFNEESMASVYYKRNISQYKRNRCLIEDRFHCVDFSSGKKKKKVDIWTARKDTEHIHYLDYLDFNINFDRIVALYIRSIIENELKKNHPLQIAEKYIWFARYYNSVVYNTQLIEDAQIIL